jgi:AbrB family looped-hinge helix DNA binding protein
VKIVAYNSQYRITIPKELAEAKGWKPGTRLRFVEMPDGTIFLKRFEGDERAETKK